MRFYFVLISTLLLIQPVSAMESVDVVIVGVDQEIENVLRIALSIERQKDADKLTPASIRALYQRAQKEIKDSLRAHGYYSSNLIQSLRLQDEKWRAKFEIDPGPPILLEAVNVVILGEGSNDAELLNAALTFPLVTGDNLVHGVYESGKKKIENLARHKGYFDATWDKRLLSVNPMLSKGEINLVFNSGTRYRYSVISLPPTVIEASYVNKMLTTSVDDHYNASELLKTQQQLQNRNYFSQVEIVSGVLDRQNKSLPIDVRLQEKKRNAYRAGAGFGTDTGPRLVASWDNRYLNSLGHRLETDLRLSLVQTTLSSAYLIPFFRGQETELGITSAISREDTDTNTSNIFQSSVQHLSQRWGWNETVSLTYQYEDFKVADESGDSNLLIPGVSYWKSNGDDPIYPKNGFRLSGDLNGSVDGLISNVSFLQFILRGKLIFPLGEKGRLLNRVQMGATLTNKLSKLPSSFRFFAGGDNSIRGFDIEALGPRNADGRVIGGKYLAVGSIEYEHNIYKKWSAALFTDFGNAFNKFEGTVEYSVGVGVRWQSPVGLVRFDLASGISDSDYPVRLHIIIGPDL